MSDFVAKVRLGAAYLDEVAPGWYPKIKLDTLFMGDTGNCVCGQVFGDFYETPIFEGVDDMAPCTAYPAAESWASERGFWLNPDFGLADYVALGEVWKLEIIRRRRVDNDLAIDRRVAELHTVKEMLRSMTEVNLV